MTQKVLFISQDIVGPSMAGPGIRTYALSGVLATHLPTVVASPGPALPDLPRNGVEFRQFSLDDWLSLKPLVKDCTVCIAQGDVVNIFPELADMDAPIVIDGYTPYLAEYLSTWAHLPVAEQYSDWRMRAQVLTRQYQVGDFFICASERQRDWWLGVLEAHGRVNPATIHDDPSLRRLVDVVPYGLQSGAIQHTRKVIRDVWPGIGDKDKLILWGGGLWPWLDPLTAIEAVAQLHRWRQDIRLVFPGTRHPNPAVADMPTHTEAAQALAARTGLLNKAVYFGDWIPFEDWGNVLLESDVALSLHFDTLETRLAFRSRIFDYIRAGLPAVVSAGDATAEIISQHNLGLVTPIADPTAVAEAIATLLDEPVMARNNNFERARALFTWERAAEPLLRFCLNPRRAPDKEFFGGNAANPTLAALNQQLEAAHKTIAAYESGRFMRMMRTLDRTKRYLRSFSSTGREASL